MKSVLKTILNDTSADQRAKVIAIYGLLGAVNVAIWIWAVIALADRPALMGTAFLAYVLGLRHAVDPDHIAAIDNVVRKLMQEGKRPHVGRAVLRARAFARSRSGSRRARSPATAAAVRNQLRELQVDRRVIGTSVSGILPARHRGW